MLTAEDREEIKRIVVEIVTDTATLPTDDLTPLVNVTARAIEVFGTREQALRWLRTPVRSLGDRTPVSLLHTPDGVAQVNDVLGQVEHGVW